MSIAVGDNIGKSGRLPGSFIHLGVTHCSSLSKFSDAETDTQGFIARDDTNEEIQVVVFVRQ